MTDKCDPKHQLRYLLLIGILRWAGEFRRIDIGTEGTLLSQYQASPRNSLLEALNLIFHHLSKNPKKRLAMDPHYPEVNERSFNIQANWTGFYEGMKEAHPPDVPELLGIPVDTMAFEDADHAGNAVT